MPTPIEVSSIYSALPVETPRSQVELGKILWEKCGITAVYNRNGEIASHFIPPMQGMLQHRGQDAAGMAVFHKETQDISIQKGSGLVHEVFSYESPGDSFAAIGHNRYGTDQSGSNRENDAATQPMKAVWEDSKGRPWEMAISFNGNLPDSEREKLRGRMPKKWRGETFDTLEINRAIVSAPGDTWEEKIRNGLVGIDMAYSLTMATQDGRVFGLRGPSGTWPLWVGETGDTIIMGSETRIDKAEINGKKILDGVSWTEVEPGELVEATPDGVKKTQLFNSEGLFRCSLHDIYGARADSLVAEGKTYGDLRKEVGRDLARVDRDRFGRDVVIAGLPTSGLPFADGYAEEMGLARTDVFTKSQDALRTYIAKDMAELARIANGKYEISNEMKAVLAQGSGVLVLLDDSIIKGTTFGGNKEHGILGTVEMARMAGAREVHVRVALPKFVEGCDLGYVVEKGKLIAIQTLPDGSTVTRTNEEIAEMIGADSFNATTRDGIQNAYDTVLGQKEITCMHCMGDEHPSVLLERKRAVDASITLIQDIPVPVLVS